MSGLLLPGTAFPSDVLAGKTYSGAVGQGIAGTFGKGILRQPAGAYAMDVSGGTPNPVYMGENAKPGDSLVLVTALTSNNSTIPSITGISGIAANWIYVDAIQSPYSSEANRIEVWLGTNIASPGGDGISFAMSTALPGGILLASLYDVVGDLSVDANASVNNGQWEVGSLAVPAGGFAVWAAAAVDDFQANGIAIASMYNGSIDSYLSNNYGSCAIGSFLRCASANTYNFGVSLTATSPLNTALAASFSVA